MKHILLLVSTILSFKVWAGAGVNYSGRILKPTGAPLEASSVAFTVSIYSPGSEKCLLYQEKQVIDMSASGGLFNLTIGEDVGATVNGVTGVVTGANRTGSDPGFPIDKVFANGLIIGGGARPLTCVSGDSYSASSYDQRLVEVKFNDGSTSGDQTLPMNKISHVPMSLNSFNASNINGIPGGAFVRVEGATSLGALTMTQYNGLLATSGLATRMTTLETNMDDKADLDGAVFRAGITSPAYFYSSDRRLKENIQTYQHPLKTILSLRGVTFDWKSNHQPEVGLIAQEVEKVDPRLVGEFGQSDAKVKSVKYGNIIAIVIEAFKELVKNTETKDQELEAEIVLLRQELGSLKKELSELRKKVDTQSK